MPGDLEALVVSGVCRPAGTGGSRSLFQRVHRARLLRPEPVRAGMPCAPKLAWQGVVTAWARLGPPGGNPPEEFQRDSGIHGSTT